MIIARDVKGYIALISEPITSALAKLDGNKSKFLVCVDEDGRLEGVLTDGDVRRWIMQHKRFDESVDLGDVCNRKVTSASVNADPERISSLFSTKVEFVPLVDADNRVRAIARKGEAGLPIGSYVISPDSPAFIIAEIGINHNGSLATAKKLIDLAADAGADSAKFQMRQMSSIYANGGNANDPSEDLGAQYTLEILAQSALSNDEMIEAFDYCRARNLIPLCSPWDLESVAVLAAYGLEGYKIASADMTNYDLLRAVSATGAPILVSTGMSSEAEIIETASLLKGLGSRFSLLHCNSTYPAPFKDINLRYLDRLAELGGTVVGYSGHERGYAVAVAAVARGAKIIEKHFTLDRNMRGNDHRVSLEPDEFGAMVKAIREVEESLGNAGARQISVGELMNRHVLAKSIVAASEISAGTTIQSSMVEVRGPGKGLQPNRRVELIGRVINRSMKSGDFFFESDLSDEIIKPRNYRFKRRWGIPVRHHDWRGLSANITPDFLEFHFSYKDINLNLADFFDRQLDMGLVVHSPDLFANDHILNLASDDDEYRRVSIANLQAAVDAARRMLPWFKNKGPIPFVVSLGGMSRNEPLPASVRPALYERVAEALTQIDSDGVEILPQTLPPFPWYFGGQLFCNLFVDPEDTAQFCRDIGSRLCLDVSHSKLTMNHRQRKFSEFVEIVGEHTAHLHLVDAKGVDGEGVQIGEGDIDFEELAAITDRVCPQASFIPEIWQGHKDGGAGFWIALDRLEGQF